MNLSAGGAAFCSGSAKHANNMVFLVAAMPISGHQSLIAVDDIFVAVHFSHIFEFLT